MSRSNFKHNDRVQALWAEDGKWYPAQVLKVKGNGVYLIQFVGWAEKYDFQAHQMRPASAPGPSAASSDRNTSTAKASGRGGARAGRGAQRSASKDRAPLHDATPEPATAPPAFAAPPSESGPQVDAQRLFDTFQASVQRPSRAADFYAALELAADCCAKEISQQLRRKSLMWHTDRTRTHAESLVPADTEKRSEVLSLVAKMLIPVHEEENRFLNEVRDALTDPHARAAYDAKQSTASLDQGMADFFAGIRSGASGTWTSSNGGEFVRGEPRASRPSRRDKSGKQPVQRQAAATSAQLQDQVQRLSGDLLSAQTAARDEIARVTAAAAEKEAQHLENVKQEAEVKSRLRNRVRHLQSAVATEDTRAKKAVRLSTVTKLVCDAKMRMQSDASRIEKLQMQSRISELETEKRSLRQQVATVQGEYQRVTELLSGLVWEKQQHESIAKEQARQQGLALQRCGS